MAPVSIADALRALPRGGIVLYPTDTLYGLGVDATNDEAIARLKDLKGRDAQKPISIAVSDMEMLREYAVATPLAEVLAHEFLPGGLTLVLEALPSVSPELLSHEGTIGVRIPNRPEALEIVRVFGKPITATSANVAGMQTENNPTGILAQFGSRAALIEAIVDAGTLSAAIPSTVVDARGEELVILREGIISGRDLERVAHS